MWGANLEKIDWIWNQDAAEDKARDCTAIGEGAKIERLF